MEEVHTVPEGEKLTIVVGCRGLDWMNVFASPWLFVHRDGHEQSIAHSSCCVSAVACRMCFSVAIGRGGAAVVSFGLRWNLILSCGQCLWTSFLFFPLPMILRKVGA
jgi:streptolysin S family bacteriocin protoxin